MAPSKLILSLFILLSFLSLSCSARPCKTLFISSYSLSIKPLDPHPNPSNPSSGFLIVIEIEETSTSTLHSNFFNRRFIPVIPKANYEKPHEIYDKKGFQETAQVGSVWHGFGSYDLSSLRDRTKDILSVVVALIFGVGCGALTAATMYLVWSFFSPSHPRFSDYFDGDFSGDDEEDVKKTGYVKIPAAEQVKGGSA